MFEVKGSYFSIEQRCNRFILALEFYMNYFYHVALNFFCNTTKSRKQRYQDEVKGDLVTAAAT